MSIIKSPIVTEKVTASTEKLNTYGFIVETKANKIQIKQAVENMYNVSVTSVNTARYLGKFKSRNTKGGIVSGRDNAFKKAFITVKEGETIDFYSNI